MQNWTFLGLLFLYMTVATYVMAGEQPFQETQLANAIGATDTTLTVASTTGFKASGYVQLNSEIMQYTAVTATTFTGVTRGAQHTEAAAHGALTRVAAEELGIINDLLGFNIVDNLTSSDGGFLTQIVTKTAGAVMLPLGISRALIMLVTFQASFFDGAASWLKIPFWAIAIGAVLNFIFSVIIRR